MIDSKRREKLVKAFFSFVCGDALGAPYEFKDNDLIPHFVTMDYNEHFNLPAGTWTDDTSLMLATMEALSHNDNYNYERMMSNFSTYIDGAFTPYGKMFDIGFSTRTAIDRYREHNENPIDCGGADRFNNGNGGIMRIMPIVFTRQMELSVRERFEFIRNVTTLTHGNEVSILGSFLYVEMLRLMLDKKFLDIKDCLLEAKEEIDNYLICVSDSTLSVAWGEYDKVFNLKKEDSLSQKSGYVVNALGDSILSVMKSSNTEEAIVFAANNADDNDTVAAITGAISALYFDDENNTLPESWYGKLANRELLGLTLQNFIDNN